MTLPPPLAALRLDELALRLDELYVARYGLGGPDWNFLEAELLACELDADPELLEAAWTHWAWSMTSWSEVAVSSARHWLDAVLIGELPVPELPVPD